MSWKAAARMFLGLLLCLCFDYFLTTSASAAVRINEIYWDPPEGMDTTAEYIELSGDPNMSLTNYYLIFLENELSATANPGVIENIFNLGLLTTPKIGSNGFLTLRQGSMNPYGPSAPGTTDLINTKVPFTWGSGTGTSSVGHQDLENDGVIENSGWTAILLRNNGGNPTRPVINQSTPVDLDADNDGVFDNAIMSNWTILDSIGVVGEESEAGAASYLYGAINFGPEDPNGNLPHVPEGSTFVKTKFELEYVGRWGNSTGSTAADWHGANLTNNSIAGFTGPADFRQSGLQHDPQPLQDGFTETTQGVPYGTNLLNSRGSANLFMRDGDFNFDGVVDGRDFLIWQRNYGYSYTNGAYTGDGVANDATRNHGDADLDRQVGAGDLAIWEAAYGTPPALTAASVAIPEPSTLLLLCGFAPLAFRRLR